MPSRVAIAMHSRNSGRTCNVVHFTQKPVFKHTGNGRSDRGGDLFFLSTPHPSSVALCLFFHREKYSSSFFRPRLLLLLRPREKKEWDHPNLGEEKEEDRARVPFSLKKKKNSAVVRPFEFSCGDAFAKKERGGGIPRLFLTERRRTAGLRMWINQEEGGTKEKEKGGIEGRRRRRRATKNTRFRAFWH